MHVIAILSPFDVCVLLIQVRVVNVEGISKELCGGTHVRNTADIRGIKIISEQGIAAGVRRIEAVCGAAFIDYVNQRDSVVKQLNSLLKVKYQALLPMVSKKPLLLVV